MPRKLWAALRRLLVRLGLLRPGKIMYIGGSDTLPPPLTREEEAARPLANIIVQKKEEGI